ncbi:MAG: molybdopterin cofactor-binding domain-containing protein [Saprospiraceae bacterium]
MVVEATYLNDFVYHAQMEPLNAVVAVAPDGKSAEAWVGSQAHDSARQQVAKTLGIRFEDVDYHPCYLGGGFGRRSMTDYVEEATLLAKAVMRPVKLIWAREDDLQYGAYRPISLQKLRVAVGADGMIQGWEHHVVGTGDGLLASGTGVEYYDFANQYITLQSIDHQVRTKHWRSVGHGPNKYAIEAILDETAFKLKVDPVAFRLKHMQQDQRAHRVVETAAQMAGWDQPVAGGRAKGIAFAERSGARTAAVVEISVNHDTGKITVHKCWMAMDAGVIVQPDNAIAQLEGGFLQGLSSVLYESITLTGGEVQQNNFDDYPLLRMEDTPEVLEVRLIPSDEKPEGVGEASLPVVGGAVANAFLALTGKTLNHMPFTPEKVLKVLNG